MTVSAINFSGNTTTANKVNGNEQTQKPTDKKPISKTTIAIGLGLAALASVGIYLATKGRAGKQIVKPEVTQKGEEIVNNAKKECKEAVENVQQKMEKIIERFNEGQYKNAPKTIKQLKNGKTTITLGEGNNKTVYIYDKNANPERQINFVNKSFTTFVPTENGQWKIDKIKKIDYKTGNTIIEKFQKEEPKFGSIKPIETTTISKEQHGDLSEFKKHKYIKNNDGPADEETFSVRTMKFGDDTVRTVRNAKLKPNESPEWEVENYVIKNNERIDKPLKDALSSDRLKKFASAMGIEV